mgnify:CR=1 FL=1
MMLENAEVKKPSEEIDTKQRVFNAIRDFMNGQKTKTGPKTKTYTPAYKEAGRHD